MDKEIVTAEQLARAEVLVHELCDLREEAAGLEDEHLRRENADRRVEITRDISGLLGYRPQTDIKNDLNDK